jgi:streptomycin 3"-adenylyltransferase
MRVDDDFPLAEPVTFSKHLAADLKRASRRLLAVYLHGSACLGGWNPSSSDVDLIIVVEDGVSNALLEPMIDVLVDRAADCPGHGIECSVVSRSAVSSIRDRWPFLAHIATDPDGIRRGFPISPTESDPDLLMHYAVCRLAGISVFGPPPVDLIAPVERAVVLGYLADEMEWGLAHGTSAYALLNACRALEYLEHDRIVSKIEGGEAVLKRSDVPADDIRRALSVQEGKLPAGKIAAAGEAFVREVAARLRAAGSQK